jgi:hypothetical protein
MLDSLLFISFESFLKTIGFTLELGIALAFVGFLSISSETLILSRLNSRDFLREMCPELLFFSAIRRFLLEFVFE